MLALYGHPFSSYTWEALIALYANDTAFEFREFSGGMPLTKQLAGSGSIDLAKGT